MTCDNSAANHATTEMADIFDSGLSALKLITKVYEIKIDNGTFKLFYKATTAILLACSFISSSKQFFGTPISCEVVRQPMTNSLQFPITQVMMLYRCNTDRDDKSWLVVCCLKSDLKYALIRVR